MLCDGQHFCLQSSLINDVRAVVAEDTNNGVGVAKGNVSRRSHEVTSRRAAAAAGTRDELNASNSFCTSRSPRDAAANPPGNPAWFILGEYELRTLH